MIMAILSTSLPRLVGAEAMAIWPLTLVVPERRHDAALLAHEEVHLHEQAAAHLVWASCVLTIGTALWVVLGVSPWWLLLALAPPWWALYLLWPAFRLAAEVRAYRVQIAARGISPAQAAQAIATRYRLDIAAPDALAMLTDSSR